MFLQNMPPSTITMKFQNIGDVDLPYLCYSGNEHTLIFVHATGFLPWLWNPIARELSPPYTIFAPYIGDYRPSDPAEGGLSWATIAQDITIFCQRKKIEDPILVGHSMGGTVLTIAHAYFGLKATGMILIEPIFLPEHFYHSAFTVQDHPLACKALNRRNRWRNATEAMTYLKTRALFKKWDSEILDLYIQYGMQIGSGGELTLVCSPRTEASLFMGGLHFNPWGLLPKISCPVLFMEGEFSNSKLYTNIEKACLLIKEAEYHTIRNAGHLIPMEQPAQVCAHIKDFLYRLLGSTKKSINECTPPTSSTSSKNRLYKHLPLKNFYSSCRRGSANT